MPIYNPMITEIDEKETRRYAGLAGHTSFPPDRVRQACEDAHVLTKAQGSWQLYAYDPDEAALLCDPPFFFDSPAVVNHLSGSLHVAALAVTIGPALEEEVSTRFSAGNYTDAYLLDAAGSAAVETAADLLNQAIVQYAARLGCLTTRRFSPGYGAWDIRNQPRLLRLAEGHLIGMKTTSSCMLTPRKSVTAVIGLLPQQPSPLPPALQAETSSCNYCTINHCHARKES